MGNCMGKSEGGAPSASGGSGSFVLGTMNIIGEATNPIEFEPNASDVADPVKYAAAKTAASASLGKYTIGEAKGHVAGNDLLSEKLTAFIASKEFADTDSVGALCSGKKLDLSLDNKMVADGGRLNAIVFALSPLPSDAKVFQIDQAATKPDEYRAAILSYYGVEWPKADESKSDALACLLLWDLLCAAAVANAADSFTELSQTSYLMKKTKGGKAIPTPREDLFQRLFEPLVKVANARPKATIIVGCQEMPSDTDSLKKALASQGSKFEVYRQPDNGTGNISGFVYSKSLKGSFSDVSEEIKPDLKEHLAGAGIDGKVIDTTLAKMVCGKFTVDGAVKLVLVFHCKSFKKDAKKQGAFIAFALKTAAEKFGGVAYVAGDMNIEAKWPKGTDAAAQRAGIEAAEKGMLPITTAENSKLFGEAVEAPGYKTYPQHGTLTTLKMRTQFQGQPEKDGDLTAVHKDYVILPKDAAVVETIIGGLQDNFSSNIELLQPSRFWPADHFAVFVVM